MDKKYVFIQGRGCGKSNQSRKKLLEALGVDEKRISDQGLTGLNAARISIDYYAGEKAHKDYLDSLNCSFIGIDWGTQISADDIIKDALEVQRKIDFKSLTTTKPLAVIPIKKKEDDILKTIKEARDSLYMSSGINETYILNVIHKQLHEEILSGRTKTEEYQARFNQIVMEMCGYIENKWRNCNE